MAEGHVRGAYAERGDLAGEYRWGDAGQIVLIGIFSVVTLLDVFWLRYLPSVSGLIPWYIRIIIGIPLVVGGIQLSRLGVNIVFGEQRKKLMVIRSGVFGWVRHPVYVGMLVFFLGFVEYIHQRPDGYVKRSVGQLTKLDAFFQDLVGGFADLDRLLSGLFIH